MTGAVIFQLVARTEPEPWGMAEDADCVPEPAVANNASSADAKDDETPFSFAAKERRTTFAQKPRGQSCISTSSSSCCRI